MKKSGVWITGVIVIIFLGTLWYNNSAKGGDFDVFAQCLTDKGIKMYGAFWCPHCMNQKAAFGKSWKKVKYIECSNPNRSQMKICNDAGIEGYPTWEFEDGSRRSGFIPLEVLANISGCSLEAEEDVVVDEVTSEEG